MSLNFYAAINLSPFYNNDGWAVRTYRERDDLYKRKGVKLCPPNFYKLFNFKILILLRTMIMRLLLNSDQF